MATQLVEKELVHSAADIYTLTWEQLLELDKFKEKSADNLLQAITASKQNNLDKLLFGFGIRNIGDKRPRCWQNISAHCRPSGKPPLSRSAKSTALAA